MHVAFDIDGTLDQDPVNFESLCSALMAAGHRVSVVTGCSGDKVSAQDKADKASYLSQIGFERGAQYDKLKVFPDPPHKKKAKWCKKHNVAFLFDNSVKNAQLASEYCTVLLPWNDKAD